MKRLIGQGVTDSSGVATIPYVGTGAGSLQIVAECEGEDGILQSETFVILDCIYIDKCTSSDHANWSTTNNFTWNDNACTITSSTSIFPKILTELTGDFTVLFKASMTSAIRLILFETSNVNNQNKWILNQTDELLYRIQRINGEFTLQHSTDDGETWSNPYTKSSGSLTTENVYFGFGIETSTSRSITFHDLKAYPI